MYMHDIHRYCHAYTCMYMYIHSTCVKGTLVMWVGIQCTCIPSIRASLPSLPLPPSILPSLLPSLPQNLQGMNAKRMEKYSSLVAQCADCYRRVFPVVNTCLDNIAQGSAAVDATKVCLSVCLSVCQSSICLSVIYLSVCLSVCLVDV